MNDVADEIPQIKPPAAWAIALAFGILFLSWGTTYKATSIAMKEEDLPPALFGGLRLFLAGSILLTYQLIRRQPLRCAARKSSAWSS